MRLRLVATLWLVLVAAALQAFDYDPALDSMSDEEILHRSRATPSSDERASLRGYLAEYRPQTAAGLIGRAWIATAEGDYPEAERLYLAAIERDPDNTLAYNNLTAVYQLMGDYELQAEYTERMLPLEEAVHGVEPLDPYENDYILYFTYLDRIGSGRRAQRYRERREAELGADHFVFANIDAVLARRDGDYERAYELRQAAIDSGNPPFWFREDHADLQFRYLYRDSQDASARIAPLNDLASWAIENESPQNQFRAITRLADALDEEFNAFRDAFELYQFAFDRYPAAEALSDTFDSARSRYGEEIIGFMERVRETLPYSPEALRIEVWNYREFDFDPERAVASGERAVEVSATPEQRRTSVQALGRALEQTRQEFDRAYELVADEDAFLTDEAPRQVFLYRNRIEAQEFAAALEHLEARRALGNISLTWYDERRLRLERLQMALADEQQQIVFGGSYDAGALAVSPDGRLAALGYYPVQLWDLHNDVKLLDLGRGGGVREFSPDGRYLATLSNYTIESGTTESALYVYRVADGKLMFVRPYVRSGTLEGLAWSPDSQRLVFGDGIGSMHVYQVDGTPAGTFRVSDVRIRSKVTWLPTGQIAVAEPQSNYIRLVDDRSFELVRELSGVSWPHTIAHTREGSYLIVSDNRYMLHVWDTERWQRRSMRIPMFAREITVHQSRPLVALIDAARNDVRAAVYDIERMIEVASYERGGRWMPAFAGDELLLGDNEIIVKLNPDSMEETGRLTSRAATGNQMLVDSTRGYAVTRDGDGAHFFHIDSGRFVHTLPTAGELFDLGRGRFADFHNGTATVYSTRRLGAEDQFEVGIRVDELATGDGVFAVAGPPLASDYDRAETARIEVYESGTYELLYSVEAPFATEYVPEAVYNAEVTGVAISDDGEFVSLLTEWRDGFGRAFVKTKDARVFDATGRLVSRINYNDNEAKQVDFDGEEEIVVRFEGFRRRYNFRTGRYLEFEGYTTGTTVLLDSRQTLVWSSSHIELGENLVFVPSFLQDVAVDERRNLLLAYTVQNQLLIYNLQTLEPIAYSVRIDRSWLTWTPEGFFTGPDTSAERLAYLVADDYSIYDMDQFFSLFFRPDVVEAKLAGIDISSEVGDLSLGAVLAPLPEVEIVAQERSGGTVEVRVVATDTGGGAQDIRLFHNGVRVAAATRGLSVVTRDETDQISAQFELSLVDGENRLRAVAFTEREVESEAATLTIEYAAPQQAQPALWLLAVGINQYRNPRYNLNYAKDDAAGFVRAVQSAGTRLYSAVNTVVIEDREASRTAIVAAIESIAEEAAAEDVFLFFYAGHGIALDPEEDGTSEFYFIPSDVTQMTDPGQVQSAALSGAEFEDLVSTIPARKQFYVLDACNSGAISAAFGIRGAAEELALSRMSRATGSALIAASRDDQFAQEFEALGQGALTAAIVEGLAGEAALGNGQITVGALKSYVEYTLPGLTEEYAGRPQFPTGFISGQDFPIGLR